MSSISSASRSDTDDMCRLKGHFSRLDFRRASQQNRRPATVIVGLGIILPPRISNPYYYDIVGNVSTSRVRYSPKSNRARLPSQKVSQADSSWLELTPRYPLMGGWNYTFTLGYDAPLEDYVRRKANGGYILSVPFITPISDIAVDDVTLRIRLPEGAKSVVDF